MIDPLHHFHQLSTGMLPINHQALFGRFTPSVLFKIFQGQGNGSAPTFYSTQYKPLEGQFLGQGEEKFPGIGVVEVGQVNPSLGKKIRPGSLIGLGAIGNFVPKKIGQPAILRFPGKKGDGISF